MKNLKQTLKVAFCSLIVPIIVGMPAMTDAILHGVEAVLNVNSAQHDFVITDNPSNEGASTYLYKCYKVDGYPCPEGVNGAVSIAWGKTAESATGDLNVKTHFNLDENEIFTYENKKYQIVGVMDAGFRRSQITTITLPNTVEEIGEEAFAYCSNLTEFTFPYNVSEVAKSTFLDCRSLTNVYFYNDSGVKCSTSDKLTKIGNHAFDSCTSLVSFNCSDAPLLTFFGYSCFQNCKKLTRFYFPSKVLGENDVITNMITVQSYAFADCIALTYVYFEDNMQTIEKFAFADCDPDMKIHYATDSWDEETSTNPEFDDKWRNKYLTTKYYDPNDKTDATHDPEQGVEHDYVYDYETDHVVINQTKQYPGLQYVIRTDDIYLDCSIGGSAAKTIKLSNGIENNKGYAVITGWTVPTETWTGYYNTSTKVLEIPSTISHKVGNNTIEYPVKVIGERAFESHTNDIYGLKFNNNLVQICKYAFYHDNLIGTGGGTISFTGCNTLKEVSNFLFQDSNNDNETNSLITTLAFPNSLEYVGRYAFYAFTKLTSISFKTNESQPGNLKVLGGLCFARAGESYKAAKTKVKLPCTLSDSAAKTAHINEQMSNSINDYNTTNWAAIGPYAFGSYYGSNANSGCSCVESIEIEDCTYTGSPHNHDHSSDTWSLSTNAFNRARFLTKFVTNDTFYRVGKEAFKNCDNIKEIRLCTSVAIDKKVKFPWGTENEGCTTYGTSLFNQVSVLNCMIYLDGPVPGKNGNTTTGYLDSYSDENGGDKLRWNAVYNPSYSTDLGNNPTNGVATQGRTTLPTYTNLNFDTDILYWQPSKRTNAKNGFLDKPPETADEYEAGTIVFAKQGGKYTVAKYYAGDKGANAVSEIDLTGIVHPTLGDISSNIDTIGPEAFAYDGDGSPGSYFILPTSVTCIKERAFYRKPGGAENSCGKYGVRVVTYYSTGGYGVENSVKEPFSNSVSYDDIVEMCDVTNKNSPEDNYGYCNLPASVTRIEKNAFYGNVFQSVSLGGSIAYIGKTAFYTNPKTNKEKIDGTDYDIPESGRSKLTSITIRDTQNSPNANFSIKNTNAGEDGGLYSNNILLYQPQNKTGTLTIASGTTAIGMGACAGTSYSTINLSAALTHIYGTAFQNCFNLSKVTGGAALKYISAMSPGDDAYSSSMPFDNTDYRDMIFDTREEIESRTSAFQNCINLEEFNFTALTNLEKIGPYAFRNCKKLKKMTGGTAQYKYYNYTGGNLNTTALTISGNPDVTKTEGVMDLSKCTKLKTIGKEAFCGCNNLEYVHFPKETGGTIFITYDRSVKTVGSNTSGGKLFTATTPKIQILVGGTARYSNFTRFANKNAYDYTNENKVYVKDHYPSNWWSNNETYYYAGSSSDCTDSALQASDKFWTDVGMPTGCYVLFSSPTLAQTYFSKYAALQNA